MLTDMTTAELRDAYRHWRSLMLNASNGRMAASMAQCLHNVEAIENEADRRRVALL